MPVFCSAQSFRVPAAAIEKYFSKALDSASIVTSEISQVPLVGVLKLFEMATARQLPTFLDVDVPPSVATGAAQLGTAAEVRPATRFGHRHRHTHTDVDTGRQNFGRIKAVTTLSSESHTPHYI